MNVHSSGLLCLIPKVNPTVKSHDSSRPWMEVWLPSDAQPGTMMALSIFYFMTKKVKLSSTQVYSGAGVVREGRWLHQAKSQLSEHCIYLHWGQKLTCEHFQEG